MARHYPILVAIETDATNFHGENARRPALLNQGEAEQMLAHISTDLDGLFPDINRGKLVMPGALYDQTQVLQPAYPVYKALSSLTGSIGDADYSERLFSIGAEKGLMPHADLQPSASVTPGILLLLPILVETAEGGETDLFEEMEHRFMAEGQLSAHSAKGLEAGFRISVRHARFMTLTDLNAMLHMQLDHFGFLPLWKLLDAALEGEPHPFLTEGTQGTVYRWDGQRVLCRFETFDEWANNGAGRSTDPRPADRIAGYTQWTREFRQYLVTLGAHAVPVVQHLPDSPEEGLDESFFVELSSSAPEEGCAQVTEHSCAEVGTIAVTVADGDRLLNLYPLRPEGLNELHAHLRSAGLAAGGVSFPGSVCLDPGASRLAQDKL